MLSAEDNELLTRVGPGTPAGELMRRYWVPAGVSADLADRPQYVRVLGEDLVLFRTPDGETYDVSIAVIDSREHVGGL